MRLILLLIVFLVPAFVRADEWWAWTLLEFIHEPPLTASLFMGHRYDDSDAFTSEIVSPRVRYEVRPWLEMGVGLSLLNLAGNGACDRHLQMRPELELNPKFNFTPNLRFDLRNRLEWRWNEEEAFTTHRSRHRIQFGWTLPHAIGPWTRVYASNEWLIDLHRQTWAENRCIPLGLTFKSSARTEMDVFYMILSTRPDQEWLHESVFGTYLKVKF